MDAVQINQPAVASTLMAAYQNYVSFLDASPRTVQTYNGNLRQFVRWASDHGIDKPRREDVIAYREDLNTRCKPSTVQNYITALRLFFRWTDQAGIYPNIADHVKGAKLDPNFKKDYLTADQAKGLLASVDTSSARGKRDYAILALMLTGGLRDVEISRANVEDLADKGGQTVLYLQGKGREERTDYVKVVPVVEQAVRSYLKTRTASGADPLFTSLSNNGKGTRLTPRSISYIAKSHLIAAGYNSSSITAHSLRHTAVTLALLGGVKLEEVQQFARHRNINTTLIYAHNLERAKNKSEDAIADSIFS